MDDNVRASDLVGWFMSASFQGKWKNPHKVQIQNDPTYKGNIFQTLNSENILVYVKRIKEDAGISVGISQLLTVKYNLSDD